MTMSASRSVGLLAKTSKTVAGAGRATHSHTRCIHQTSCRRAVTKMEMPAMSPTMTEGGIASWKKREGEAFAPGDVLLEIETDKATIDVEAQEDGIVGKIIIQDGAKNVPVGKVIALLAEEGDDISNLEVPKEEPKAKASSSTSEAAESSKAQATSAPSTATSETSAPASSTHAHNLPHRIFPSVHRLLLTNSSKIPDLSKITGTGLRGMITKGDVLAFLGVISHPLGSAKDFLGKKEEGVVEKKGATAAKEAEKPLDGPALRRLIVSTMLQSSIRARNAASSSVSAPADFDSVIADYLPAAPPVVPSPLPAKQGTPKSTGSYLDGLY
ncbi:hypothetical protein HGRIS_013585 [Hohenbuehelia grisea]|uniref:Single hybrid motif-containing protein n=1 Tax=Hohenbuehelia grisea TaxID=104357 RepID=A0ABR3IVS5_9AGAR